MVKLLFIFASFQAILAVLILNLVYPQMTELYTSLETEIPTNNSLISIALVIVFSAIQFMYGFKLKRIERVSKKQENIATLLLVISFISSGYLIASSLIQLISPIYQITSSVK